MDKGIIKLKNLLIGISKQQFNSNEYIEFYLVIYNLCIQKPPINYFQELYDKKKGVFDEYINSTMLIAFREKHEEFMLKELVKR